jgi:hypothetical protein
VVQIGAATGLLGPSETWPVEGKSDRLWDRGAALAISSRKKL